MKYADRLYVPSDITLEELTAQLDELELLDSDVRRNAIAPHKLMLDLRNQRQQTGRYASDDIAAMLAKQTEKDATYWTFKIMEAWRDGLLKFWLQDGTPCDYLNCSDAPRPMEYYLGLDNEYTTSEAVNDWLEAWGAKFSFNGSSKQPKIKKMAYQAQLIIEAIERLGHNPQQLPKPNGRAGVKKQVREQLDGRYPFDEKTAFDTAWKENTEIER